MKNRSLKIAARILAVFLLVILVVPFLIPVPQEECPEVVMQAITEFLK